MVSAKKGTGWLALVSGLLLLNFASTQSNLANQTQGVPSFGSVQDGLNLNEPSNVTDQLIAPEAATPNLAPPAVNSSEQPNVLVGDLIKSENKNTINEILASRGRSALLEPDEEHEMLVEGDQSSVSEPDREQPSIGIPETGQPNPPEMIDTPDDENSAPLSQSPDRVDPPPEVEQSSPETAINYSPPEPAVPSPMTKRVLQGEVVPQTSDNQAPSIVQPTQEAQESSSSSPGQAGPTVSNSNEQSNVEPPAPIQLAASEGVTQKTEVNSGEPNVQVDGTIESENNTTSESQMVEEDPFQAEEVPTKEIQSVPNPKEPSSVDISSTSKPISPEVDTLNSEIPPAVKSASEQLKVPSDESMVSENSTTPEAPTQRVVVDPVEDKGAPTAQLSESVPSPKEPSIAAIPSAPLQDFSRQAVASSSNLNTPKMNAPAEEPKVVEIAQTLTANTPTTISNQSAEVAVARPGVVVAQSKPNTIEENGLPAILAPAVVAKLIESENNTIPETQAVSPALGGQSIFEYYKNYVIDPISCDRVKNILPNEVLNMTIERILQTISSQNCSETMADIKLKSAINKSIKGQVMEVSSVSLDLTQLMTSTRTKVTCVSPNTDNEVKGDKSKVRFGLKFELEPINHKLRSKWRRYPKLGVDEMPFEMFGRSQKDGKSLRAGSKCQKFKLESGDFYLELKSIKTSLSVEVTLVKLDERAYAASYQLGGKIQVNEYRVDRMQLSHKIDLNGPTRRITNGGGYAIVAPTLLIMHDNNNHHRRNNWLLDLYGNWIRHEYRNQLSHLLTKPLANRLNSCFVS